MVAEIGKLNKVSISRKTTKATMTLLTKPLEANMEGMIKGFETSDWKDLQRMRKESVKRGEVVNAVKNQKPRSENSMNMI